MKHKFLIVLFATVLYNGIMFYTVASPVNVLHSDERLPEEKPPTALSVTTEQTNKKVETISVPFANNNSVHVPQKESVIPQHSETTIVSNSSVTSTTGVNPPAIDVRNVSQASVSKNLSQVIDNKNISNVIDNKNSSQAADVKNTSVPTAVPIDKNSSLLPLNPSTNISSTNSSIPTTKTTVTPVVSTLAPISSTVVVKNNKPAPSEEKHFDGPSFIGGIVLTIGLTAIGFIAFKYYKSGKIEKNYRTL